MEKYEPFGGSHAAFDPISNLRVGVQVLRECIARHRRRIEASTALGHVGAAHGANSDGGCKDKVMAEHGRAAQVKRRQEGADHRANGYHGAHGPVGASSAAAPSARGKRTPQSRWRCCAGRRADCRPLPLRPYPRDLAIRPAQAEVDRPPGSAACGALRPA
ncbi:MAG: hypothetical protein U1E95_04950 [Rubrivivax sp.]